MKKSIVIALFGLSLAGLPLSQVQAEVAKQAEPSPQQVRAERERKAKEAQQKLLQRMYNMRIRFEQERAAAENMARANVRLASPDQYRHMDAPTVTALRQQTNQQLSRFEQMFRCLDVDVEGNTGNTVVICGDNSGDISGRNVHAERDIVTVQGGGQQ